MLIDVLFCDCAGFVILRFCDVCCYFWCCVILWWFGISYVFGFCDCCLLRLMVSVFFGDWFALVWVLLFDGFRFLFCFVVLWCFCLEVLCYLMLWFRSVCDFWVLAWYGYLVFYFRCLVFGSLLFAACVCLEFWELVGVVVVGCFVILWFLWVRFVGCFVCIWCCVFSLFAGLFA